MMGWLEWTLQLALVALLAGAMPFLLRLERGLRAVRQDRGALEGGARDLAEATRMAEAASLRLRASAETAGRQVAERLAAAEPLRDDLRYLVERAEALADRLEGLVRTNRSGGAATAAEAMAAAGSAPPPGRSQAERDLLRALRLAR